MNGPSRARGTFAVLTVLALLGGTRGAAAQSTAELDEYIEAAMEAWRVPGLAIAIVKDDSVVHARGYGVREVGRPDPVDERTLFAIGSSSKAFTVAAIAMLVQGGELSWDDRAAAHLPELEFADPYLRQEVRVRDLVTHRVGVERADMVWYGTPYSREEIVRRVRHLRTIASLRSRFDYNNIMFLAAGQIVARLSGRSWDDFVTERILRPLGMSATNTSTRALEAQANVATPHMLVDGTAQPIAWRNLDNIAPAGSINSNAIEMAQWLRLHLGAGTVDGVQLLTPASVREMHAPQTIIPVSEWLTTPGPIPALAVPGTHFMAYGLGWFLQDYRGRKAVIHGGAIDGMRAEVAMLPEDDLGVVILTNLDGSANTLPEALIFRVFDHYLGGPRRDWAGELLAGSRRFVEQATERQRAAAAAVPEATRPSLPLERYAGTYADSLYGEARIVAEDGKLVLHLPGFVADLAHWSYDTFRGAGRDGLRVPLVVSFDIEATGRPSRLSIEDVGDFERRPDGARAASR